MLTATRSLNIFSNGAVENAVKPKFARVLHCSQSPYTDYKRYTDWRGLPGKGFPSVFKYIQGNNSVVTMTRPIQEWIFGLFRESANGSMTEAELITAWTSTTADGRAFNDHASRGNGYADFIRHENEQAEGMRAQPIMCTGATIRLKGDAYLGSESKGGVRVPTWFQDFYILDVKATPDPAAMGITWASHWWLIMAATNSFNLDNGGERVDPFPKMKADRATPWPLLGFGTDTGTIQRDWLELVYQDEKPEYPYMPRRVTPDAGRWNSV